MRVCRVRVCRSLPSLHQHGHIYEFNTSLLLAMADHLFSCRFGNWLTDCRKKTLESRVHERTVSFWTFVQHNKVGWERKMCRRWLQWLLCRKCVRGCVHVWCMCTCVYVCVFVRVCVSA